MADEDDQHQDPDPEPEPEQRIFTLTEAERARRDLEPFLLEAMDCRKKLAGLETDLSAVSARITMMGGVVVPYEKLATLRVEHQHLAEALKSSLQRILETGCLIKDLEVGLLDFPALSTTKRFTSAGGLAKTAFAFTIARTKGSPAASRLILATLDLVTSCSNTGFLRSA